MDKEILKSIYDTTNKLIFDPNQCKVDGECFHKTTLECILNKDYLGWSYEIGFLLTPLFEHAILNRGILTFHNIPCHYCWIEIFKNNKWYSFNPCTNQIIEKNIFDEMYQAQVLDYFTSDRIRTKLFHNIVFPDKYTSIENEGIVYKIRTNLRNQMYEMIPTMGLILPSNDKKDVCYGLAYSYTLKKSKHNTIDLLKATYLVQK